MKRTFAALLLSYAAIAACSSDDDSSNTNPNEFDFDGGTRTDSSGGSPDGLPSGALIRVFNAYDPLSEEPGPVDLYPDAYALEGAIPKVTVPYGTLSELYDPTVKDEAGNMFASMYFGGTTGNGNALMSKTETLKGGEVISYFLFTGENTQESGRRFGALRAYFHELPEGDSVGTELGNGNGVLTVDAWGLDQVLTTGADDFWYLGTGAGCVKGIGDTEFTTTAAGPGTAANYALAPGSYTGTLYRDTECTADPVIENVAFTIAAGVQSVLFVYSPGNDELRTAVVPLEPKAAPVP